MQSEMTDCGGQCFHQLGPITKRLQEHPTSTSPIIQPRRVSHSRRRDFSPAEQARFLRMRVSKQGGMMFACLCFQASSRALRA